MDMIPVPIALVSLWVIVVIGQLSYLTWMKRRTMDELERLFKEYMDDDDISHLIKALGIQVSENNTILLFIVGDVFLGITYLAILVSLQ